MADRRTYKWHELAGPEVAALARETNVAIIPVGCVEMHGVHTPTGADGIEAEGIAELIAQREPAIIMPTLYYNINDEMMGELEKVKARTEPQEVLLVVDAMTGQDAVRVADEFNKRVGLTGLILTKVDGDARGGAAISVRAVTGVPIKFLGVGEKTDALEVFHPDRLAGRILGMGDVLSAIEKAQQVMDQESAMKMGQKMVKGEFDLEDFRAQLQQLKKMGPLTQLLEMIPGMSSMTKQLSPDVTDQQLKVIEAIINSMTPEERHSPRIINASRKRRICRGSGTSVQDVNELLSQFRQMQKMMKQLGDMGRHGRGRGRGLLSMFGGL